jgi:integrase
MSVGYLVREFEASPKFARYVPRTREDYSYMYRALEAQLCDATRMFGDLEFSKVTRQLAYRLYEKNVIEHGYSSANKTMGAWQSAFRYGMLRFSEIATNPFSDLDKLSIAPRRQRWTDHQLAIFVKKANELGYPAVGRCALMCMELMQRPGDVLSLRWSAYDPIEAVWHIRQSKRGANVRVPETRRLRVALNAVRRSLKMRRGIALSENFVCATKTGKRWHRRNFTKTARRVARAARLPDDLQIRDLRRTAATEGASAGATPAEMMAVGGWANQASIRPYLVQTREQAEAFQTKRDFYRHRRSNKSALTGR